ncbi:MAG TPA: SwmB domain-containing protein [Methylophilaceae bacterium]
MAAIRDEEGNIRPEKRATKADVGLSNVDNTSDMNKPVSTAQAQAIAQAVSEHVADEDAHPIYIKTVNGLSPDEAGNVEIEIPEGGGGEGGGGSIDLPIAMSDVEGLEEALSGLGETVSGLGSSVSDLQGAVSELDLEGLQEELDKKIELLPGVQITFSGGSASTTRASHCNRPTWSDTDSAATIALPDDAEQDDNFEHRGRGNGAITYTGVTAPAGYKATSGPGELFTAIFDDGEWISTTPNTTAIATSNISGFANAVGSALESAFGSMFPDAFAEAFSSAFSSAFASAAAELIASEGFVEKIEDIVGEMVVRSGGDYNDAAGTISMPGGDAPLDSVVSAVVEDLARDVIVLTLSDDHTGSAPSGDGGFTVTTDDEEPIDVESVTFESGAVIHLNLDRDVKFGETITLDYEPPETNPISTAAGAISGFSEFPVTNNVEEDEEEDPPSGSLTLVEAVFKPETEDSWGTSKEVEISEIAGANHTVIIGIAHPNGDAPTVVFEDGDEGKAFSAGPAHDLGNGTTVSYFYRHNVSVGLTVIDITAAANTMSYNIAATVWTGVRSGNPFIQDDQGTEANTATPAVSLSVSESGAGILGIMKLDTARDISSVPPGYTAVSSGAIWAHAIVCEDAGEAGSKSVTATLTGNSLSVMSAVAIGAA